MRKLFIIGTQGIPAKYGGLETFAEEVSVRLANRGIDVFVTCENKSGDQLSQYRGVNLIPVSSPANNLRTIVADRKALARCNKIANAGDIIFLQGYGAGPFIWNMVRSIKKRGIKFWLNPDGLEWKRPRWSPIVRKYLKFSEGLLIGLADIVVCDAIAIRDYTGQTYGVSPERMKVIEYGAPIRVKTGENMLQGRNDFLKKHNLKPGEYYIYVGRFVADNNLELMIRGVLQSPTRKKLLVLAPFDPNDSFYNRIIGIIKNSGQANKVVLAGGIYDIDLKESLRLGAFAYLHGHEVGGTNPALVEAMGLGSFIIALNTVFNREVLKSSAIFFEKSPDSFIKTLASVEEILPEKISNYQSMVIDRVRHHYNWERIASLYENLVKSH